MPLFGIVSSDQSDPLYWLRMMLASNRGTLMELGTTPIISSGMVFQLLAGTHLIDVNLDLKSDRELYQTAQKLFAIILSFGQACVFVLTGLVSSLLPISSSNDFTFPDVFDMVQSIKEPM
jgi:protein transport protein SEC61 subunit alpha